MRLGPSLSLALAAGLSGGTLGVVQAQPAPGAPVAAPTPSPPIAAPSPSPRPAASAPAASAPSAPSTGTDPRRLFDLPVRQAPAPCDEPEASGYAVGGEAAPLRGARREGRARREDCALSPDPLAERSPLLLTTWLDAAQLMRLPVGDALHDSQVAFTLGALPSDGGGPVIAGASGLENRWTVEGAPVDSVRTGGADTRLPLPFLAGVRVTTGGFSARDRASSGGVIEAELIRGGAEHEARAWAWAGLQTRRLDRPVPPGSFAVVQGRIVDPAFATVTAVATGPVPGLGRRLGGRAWYAVGVAPTVVDITFDQKAVRLVDRDSDGVIDLDDASGFVTEPVARTSVAATAYNVPMMARLGLDRPEQTLELSLLGTAARSARFLTVTTPEAAGVHRDTLLLDGIATWRRRFARTALRAQIAWHRTARDESALADGAGDAPQLQTAFVPTREQAPQLDPRVAAACRDAVESDDTGDLYPLIPNCPVPTGWFMRDGVGLLTDVATDRPSFSVDLVRRLGDHAVRVGAAGEDARMVIDSRYSGGALVRSLFAGHEELVRLSDANRDELELCATNIDVACPTADRVSLTYRTRHLAAYLEDTWRPRRDLLIDFGLRWEYQQLGSRLKLADNLAPRAGAAWDPLGRGRSRLAATFGRTFTYLPAGLGELIDKAPATIRDITFMDSSSRVIETGFVARVRSDVAAMTTDEATFSAEVAWPRLVRLRLSSQHRWLRSGLENDDRGFGNPATATRRVDLLGAELATSQVENLDVRVGYAWGQARGSLVGAYDPRRGAILYGSSDFDELVTNTDGTLPSDLGHRFYADLGRAHRFSSELSLEAAARLTLASGRPQSLVAESGLWGSIYLLPRGSAARLPSLLSTDLRVAARFRTTALSLQVQNLFSREVVTGADEVYARGLFSPIDGGDAADLVFLKSAVGTPLRRAQAYGTPTSYQLPLVVFFGAESSF